MAEVLLNSVKMAQFAARGFLMLESVVPESINQRFLSDIGHVPEDEVASPLEHYGKVMSSSAIPVVPAGVPLHDAYPAGSALSEILAVPEVAGAIQSLVGKAPVFDHHFLHITFPPSFYTKEDAEQVSQHTHQDSTIDPRQAFDLQIMYFPHDVTREMGGTRFIPGSHLRRVSEVAIGRYQNIRGQQHTVCPAGSILLMHMGIWHGGGLNQSDRMRYMFKIRMQPTERQVRLWDDTDLANDHYEQRPIFWTGAAERDPVQAILMKTEPWFEQDTGRLELMNRVRFWRYLLGDDQFDADYWLTRIERDFPAR